MLNLFNAYFVKQLCIHKPVFLLFWKEIKKWKSGNTFHKFT